MVRWEGKIGDKEEDELLGHGSHRTLCAFMCEIHNSDSIGFELHWIRRHIGTPW